MTKLNIAMVVTNHARPTVPCITATSTAHTSTILVLIVLNLVAGFQALGTLLSVRLMIVPAATARFWASRVVPMCALAVVIGAAYLASVLLSPRGLLATIPRARHRAA